MLSNSDKKYLSTVSYSNLSLYSLYIRTSLKSVCIKHIVSFVLVLNGCNSVLLSEPDVFVFVFNFFQALIDFEAIIRLFRFRMYVYISILNQQAMFANINIHKNNGVSINTARTALRLFQHFPLNVQSSKSQPKTRLSHH